MTNQAARNQVFASMEAQRTNADYSARPVVEGKERAIALYEAMIVAKQDGRMAQARAYAMQLKPIMHLLGEE